LDKRNKGWNVGPHWWNKVDERIEGRNVGRGGIEWIK